MSTPGLRTGVALVVLTMVVAAAGCGAHAVPPVAPVPPSSTRGAAQSTDSTQGTMQGGDANARAEAPLPNQDGQPACADYDSWRPSGAGIIVTYWFEGTDPVTALVRQRDRPDLSQTVDNDASQRYHAFEFPGADPTAVTEVLIATGTITCYVAGAPS